MVFPSCAPPLGEVNGALFSAAMIVLTIEAVVISQAKKAEDIFIYRWRDAISLTILIGVVNLAFEKQLFTEWIFPLIVGAVIVALRPLPAKGLFE